MVCSPPTPRGGIGYRKYISAMHYHSKHKHDIASAVIANIHYEDNTQTDYGEQVLLDISRV
jgi:hypothetical protein